MYRIRAGELEGFLVHPGGPFWIKKDLGAWTIPKGEYADNEKPLTAALREFHEETGFSVDGPFHELGTIRQASGKLVTAWAVMGDCDPAMLVSNHCQVEWPPRSGRLIDIPEIDRGAWFPIPEARKRILSTQTPFLDSLIRIRNSQQLDRPDPHLDPQPDMHSERGSNHSVTGPHTSSS